MDEKYKPLTWGEFKAWVEKFGVTDETPIGVFDFSHPTKGDLESERLTAHIGDNELWVMG